MSIKHNENSSVDKVKGHEQLDVRASSIVKFAIGLAVVIVLCMFLMAKMYSFLGAHQPVYGPPPSPLVKGRRIPPGPLLEVSEGPTLQALHAKEDAILNNYGWVDKQTGTVRMPIDRAMDLLLKRGLPVRSQSGAAPTSQEGTK